jgi:hypothetical protein
VLLPHALVFSFRGQALLAASDHEGIDDVTGAYRAAGIWIEPILESNRDKIATLSDWFAVSCGLVAVEVMLWNDQPRELSDGRGLTRSPEGPPRPRRRRIYRRRRLPGSRCQRSLAGCSAAISSRGYASLPARMRRCGRARASPPCPSRRPSLVHRRDRDAAPRSAKARTGGPGLRR